MYVFCRSKVSHNVSRLCEVANFGTDYFLLKIIFLAKREREFTEKFAISQNRCCAFGCFGRKKFLLNSYFAQTFHFLLSRFCIFCTKIFKISLFKFRNYCANFSRFHFHVSMLQHLLNFKFLNVIFSQEFFSYATDAQRVAAWRRWRFLPQMLMRRTEL